MRLEEIMEEAKPKAPLKGLAEGAAPSFPSGSKARATSVSLASRRRSAASTAGAFL